MCGSPSNIHLSPPSDPVKRIAVFNLLPLQWNEAEIYVMLPVASWRNVLYEKAITHANTCQQAICGVRQRGWPVCSGLLEKENCPSLVSSCEWHIMLTKNFLLEQCMLGQSANCINFATTKAHSSVVTFLQFLRPINEVRILASHWECILSVNGSCHSSR